MQRFAFLLVTSGRVTEALKEMVLPWNCALVTAEDFDGYFGVTIGTIMRHMFAGMYEMYELFVTVHLYMSTYLHSTTDVSAFVLLVHFL